MTNQTDSIHILVTLYRAASRGQFLSESKLSDATGLGPEQLVPLLQGLDRAGLVEWRLLRLTLAGLALAVAASRKPRQRTVAKAA